jgi:hypothetical protein
MSGPAAAIRAFAQSLDGPGQDASHRFCRALESRQKLYRPLVRLSHDERLTRIEPQEAS